MKTPHLAHSPVPLPIDVQIGRASNRMAALAFAAGLFVGSIGASIFWCWLTWNR